MPVFDNLISCFVSTEIGVLPKLYSSTLNPKEVNYVHVLIQISLVLAVTIFRMLYTYGACTLIVFCYICLSGSIDEAITAGEKQSIDTTGSESTESIAYEDFLKSLRNSRSTSSDAAPSANDAFLDSDSQCQTKDTSQSTGGMPTQCLHNLLVTNMANK